jgi:hypothetical protein
VNRREVLGFVSTASLGQKSCIARNGLFVAHNHSLLEIFFGLCVIIAHAIEEPCVIGQSARVFGIDFKGLHKNLEGGRGKEVRK